MGNGHNEGPASKNKIFSLSWLREHVVEAIIVSFITVFIAILGWIVTDYTDKIKKIEHTIAKHHGPEWENIERIIEAVKLQEDVKRLHNNVDSLSEQLKKERDVIDEWTKQVDKIMQRMQQIESIAYAHITMQLNNDENLVLINKANRYSMHYKIGYDIHVENLDSPNHECILAKVESTYHDLDNNDVLIQINKRGATSLNFTREMGKIRVAVRVEELPPDRRWKTIEDIWQTH